MPSSPFFLFLFACLWLTGIPLTAHAQTPVALQRIAQGMSLQGQIGVRIDPSGKQRLDDILREATHASWQYPSEPLRMHGSSAWWLKLNVVQREADDHWVLAFPTTAIRDIEFHGPFLQGHPHTGPTVATGLIRPYSTRPMSMERITFSMPLPGQGEYTIYIRIQNTVAQNITPALWEVSDYVMNRQHKRLFDGIVYGILFTLLLYNLTLAGVFRDATYVHYVLTCTAALLTIGTFNGHTAHYLWPHTPWWIEHSYVIWPALWLAFSAGFARAFLATRSTNRAVDQVMMGIATLAAVSAGTGMLGYTAMAQRANEVLALLGIVTITGIAVWTWRRGYQPARWYLLAQLTLFATVAGVVLVSWGWWDAPFMLSNGLQLGIAAEMVVFAIALSARIRSIQQETTVLSLRAAHLAQAALTDPLTGLANRRGLAEIAQKLLALPGRHALILFDLNRFKPINDNHGHEVGDQVLITIAQRLEQHCRESDIAARLGGDEFVVMLGHCPDRTTLEGMVQRLCDAIAAPVQWKEHTFQVSASAGVAIAPDDGKQLQPLIRLADQAMYKAKTGLLSYAFAGSVSAR